MAWAQLATPSLLKITDTLLRTVRSLNAKPRSDGVVVQGAAIEQRVRREATTGERYRFARSVRRATSFPFYLLSSSGNAANISAAKLYSIFRRCLFGEAIGTPRYSRAPATVLF